MKAAILTLACCLAFAGPAVAAPVRLVVLGDSLSAGYQLPEADALPARLQALLVERGLDVEVVNAGVSGDTASDGLARLDWSIDDKAQAVIVELGANDALRGINPSVTRKAMDGILAKLTGKGTKVLLLGMLAPPNLGPDYGTAFNTIYPDLAAKYGVPLYPFVMEGIYGDDKLLLADRMHPNAEGTRAMAKRLLPMVEALIAGVRR
jgi:acyl-CoA thioesterase-1